MDGTEHRAAVKRLETQRKRFNTQAARLMDMIEEDGEFVGSGYVADAIWYIGEAVTKVNQFVDVARDKADTWED